MHPNRLRAAARTLALVVAVVVASALAACGGNTQQGNSAQHTSAGVSMPRYQHVFVMVMENAGYDDIIGNTNAPHINALAQQYALATSYYGVTHPSEPNYVALVGGSFYGIHDDAAYSTHSISNPSLADQLTQAHLTWKTYQQSMPSVGFTGTAYPSSVNALYASKHNPFMNFESIRNNPAQLANSVPATQLATDLSSGDVPNFSLIVPDQCHDMHGTVSCPISTVNVEVGDQYANTLVGEITGASFWNTGNNAIVVTWDESENVATGCCGANPGGGKVVTIVITNHGPRHIQDATPYNHYSLLLTIQDAFRLGCLQNTCDTANVTPMTTLFQSGK